MAKNIYYLFLALGIFNSLTTSVIAVETVTISLFATDLNKCDDLSKCDAYVEILCVTSLSDGRECGKTKYIKNDNFPVWPEEFTFTNTSTEIFRRWQLKVLDHDDFFDDHIATVIVPFADFIAGTETQRHYKLDLGGRGSLYVTRVRSS
ncbi:unnamed protein product [Allacma fusca]|uniref:C2 domain-containing protein n=2 Tax=Allacma fusca TaxID=39272 RepID=A0A8J2JSP5_9HEXA|nr:unnamed protein product [Allacma fusca]